MFLVTSPNIFRLTESPEFISKSKYVCSKAAIHLTLSSGTSLGSLKYRSAVRTNLTPKFQLLVDQKMSVFKNRNSIFFFFRYFKNGRSKGKTSKLI